MKKSKHEAGRVYGLRSLAGLGGLSSASPGLAEIRVGSQTSDSRLRANGIGRFARTCGLTTLTRRLHELFDT